MQNIRQSVQNTIAPILRQMFVGKKFRHFRGAVVEIDSIAVSVNYYGEGHCDVDVIYHDIEKMRLDGNNINRPEEVWSCKFSHFLSMSPENEDALRFEPINDDELRHQMLERRFPWIDDERLNEIM